MATSAATEGNQRNMDAFGGRTYPLRPVAGDGAVDAIASQDAKVSVFRGALG